MFLLDSHHTTTLPTTTAVHLDVLDGSVVGQPVGQSRRPPGRNSVETHVQVGEGVVDTQSFSETEAPLVAQPVSSDAQPPQLLRWGKVR